MNVEEQFKKMSVRAIQSEINKLDQNEYFHVKFEEVFSNINDIGKISGSVNISFKKNGDERDHIIFVCWRSGWGVSFEHDTDFKPIKLLNLLEQMYLKCA